MQKTRLKDLREDKDLLQKDIAQILNMKQQQYSRYETDENEITVTLLKQLAEFYNTSTDYILRLTDEKKPYPKEKNKN
ncbi:MAG: helix-turn-helix transcriptional regulator [Clostridia bacterium]|jgi:transcriptional regulator with XRE-family HTH domain|nr:helix-turn-helix transcriptional regulator [Clostridia bacterium]